MGRPSVAAERRRQIIDATIRCLAAQGLAGATLERIAEEAGMARGHVRHFAGNRDELLVVAARAFYFDDLEPQAEASIFPADTDTVERALDYLFGDFTAPDPANSAALAFVEASRTLPDVREVVISAYLGTQRELARLLAAAAAETVSRAECDRVAYGVVSIALGTVFLSDIEESPERVAVGRSIAEQLVSSIRNSQ